MTNIPGSNKVILDSDALIGIIHDEDVLHGRCLEIYNALSTNNFETITPYSITLEAATTLARDTSINRPDLAARLLSDAADVEQNHGFDYDVSGMVSDLYDSKTSKKNTPFDHYVLALAKKNNIKYVFSFDTFYEKNGLILAEDLLK